MLRVGGRWEEVLPRTSFHSDAVDADVGALTELQPQLHNIYNIGSYFSMVTKFVG